jgi:hypothetical protein
MKMSHPIAVPATQSSISVIRWHDPVVETNGYAIDDPYIEMFWLPILGPTATWLARRLASGLMYQPEGYTCDMSDLAQALGVSYSQGRHNPFARALHRCSMFGVSQYVALEPVYTVSVRTVLPHLPLRHLGRLPQQLRIAHDDWVQPH